MTLTPLLKYFIEGTISYKEYTTVEHHIGLQVKEADINEEFFHVEIINNDLCKIYRIQDWRENVSRIEAIKIQSEQDRQERFRREEIINKAKFRLMNKKVNPLSEEKAMELIINILSGDEIYAEMAERLELSSLINVKR